MRVPLTDAKAQLGELVRLAEEGDDIILTRHGRAAVRLVPVKARPTPSPQEKRALLESLRASGARKGKRGPNAARSQDFLFDVDGLPK